MSWPDPIPNPETEYFWAAAREGRFVLRRCSACGQAHWYPRVACPFCQSEAAEWVEATGRGVIYSFTRIPRADGAYVLAYVELAEGPRMLSNIVGEDLDHLDIGQPVQVLFRQSAGGFAVPVFKSDKAVAQ